MKKFIPIIMTIVFFTVIVFVFGFKNNSTETANNQTSNISNVQNTEESTSDNNINNETSTSDNELLNISEKEKINNLVVEFLKSYYSIHSDDNSKNYALEHFEKYKIYMTDECQNKFKPKEVSEEENQHIGYQYHLDLLRYKIYSDIDFKENHTESKVLCFIQTRTQLGDIKPNTSTALLNLSLKKENGSWLVNDIVINKLIDFPIKTDLLFE